MLIVRVSVQLIEVASTILLSQGIDLTSRVNCDIFFISILTYEGMGRIESTIITHTIYAISKVSCLKKPLPSIWVYNT